MSQSTLAVAVTTPPLIPGEAATTAAVTAMVAMTPAEVATTKDLPLKGFWDPARSNQQPKAISRIRI